MAAQPNTATRRDLVDPADPADPPAGSTRRIRADVRDGVYVMAFSCLASTVTATAFVGLARLAG